MLIELEVFGDVQLHRELLRFADAAADASPAFEKIARQGSGAAGVYSLRGIERRQFQSGGQFASGGWAPLAPATVRAKSRRGQRVSLLRQIGTSRSGYANLFQLGGGVQRASFSESRGGTVRSNKVLQDSGRLRASLVGPGPGHVEIVSPHQVVFGTQVSYARFHQLGTRRMPRRRVLELREQDRRNFVRILQKHLLGEE